MLFTQLGMDGMTGVFEIREYGRFPVNDEMLYDEIEPARITSGLFVTWVM